MHGKEVRQMPRETAAQRYRRLAEEDRQRAATTDNEDVRRYILDAAKYWDKRALESERLVARRKAARERKLRTD